MAERDWRMMGGVSVFIGGDVWRSYAAATPAFVPRRRPHTVEHARQPTRKPR